MRFFLSYFIKVFFLTTVLYAYEPKLGSVVVPSYLEKGQGEFVVKHKFFKEKGANVLIGLKYQVFKDLEIKLFSLTENKEFSAAVSYKIDLSFMLSQIEWRYYTFDNFKLQKRRHNFLNLLLSVQSKPILKRVYLTVNSLYDGYNKAFLFSGGIRIKLVSDLGMITDISIVGEYYPVFDKNLNTLSKNVFQAGIDFSTYGHHFMLKVSNSTDEDIRRLANGAYDNQIYFGFTITRLFDF